MFVCFLFLFFTFELFLIWFFCFAMFLLIAFCWLCLYPFNHCWNPLGLRALNKTLKRCESFVFMSFGHCFMQAYPHWGFWNKILDLTGLVGRVYQFTARAPWGFRRRIGPQPLWLVVRGYCSWVCLFRFVLFLAFWSFHLHNSSFQTSPLNPAVGGTADAFRKQSKHARG